MNATTYGLDVAKGVFQMYWVDSETAENRRFRRDELIGFLAQRPARRVALEACGSGHWWARKIKALGHEAVLLHASFIRPFVQTNKTDAADAKAIWTAANQPAMRTVAVKTQDQQSMLGLHRMRALLVKFRTMQVNQLRGLLYEFGVTLRAGRLAGLSEIRKRMAQLESELPGMLWIGLRDQLKRIDELDTILRQEDRYNTLGLGKNVPIFTTNGAESLTAVVDGKVVEMRVPYPAGFFTKLLDARVDDPKAGWKGKGVWTMSGTRTVFHNEGGTANSPKVYHIQLRPNPLAE